MKNKPQKLEKIFSREHNLLYYELWYKSDLQGMQLFEEKLPPHVFITMPRGKQGGGVWYEPKEMARLKERIIKVFQSPAGPSILKKLTQYQEESWAEIGPYILKKKFIQNWLELQRFYTISTHYWVSMNSFIWETVDDQRIPALIRDTVLSWRRRSEAYSERANALEFIDATYPHLQNITWFLTLAEFGKVVIEKASAAEMEQFQARCQGCFMINGKVYPLKKLDEELHRHKLELHNITEKDIKEVKGTTAYGGLVSGTVKIIHGFRDLRKIQEKDVLVTPMTSPDYVPVMGKVSAIITDEGGMLCHAAIVARELGKPCIVGTKIATQVFKDGDIVEVDADKGTVRKIK